MVQLRIQTIEIGTSREVEVKSGQTQRYGTKWDQDGCVLVPTLVVRGRQGRSQFFVAIGWGPINTTSR